MKLYISHSHNPYYNLAVEEYLFRNEEDEVFMLWQNDRTAVVGKNQNIYTELNLEKVKAGGIKIARRITGGGAVYHDLGNLNYSYIGTAAMAGENSFLRFSEPIISALASLGVSVVLSGRNDLTVDGRKISGAAEHTEAGRTLHHGTLLFDSDLSVLSECLSVDREKLSSKGISSVSSRVTNIKPYLPEINGVAELISAIAKEISEKHGATLLPLPSCPEISELEKKYSSEGWLYPKRRLVSEYTRSYKRRFPFGSVEVLLSLSGEEIVSADISGDFFEGENFSLLKDAFLGEISELKSRIERRDLDGYIIGMRAGDLLELFELC